MNAGFTGVGVGPGDPELMTIKALHAIEKSEVIALPVSDPSLTEALYVQGGGETELDKQTERYLENCTAYQIAEKAMPQIRDKDKILLPMPMIKDKGLLKEIHDHDAEAVAGLLDTGRSVSFLTLGDPTVYSTCMYVHKRLKQMGYRTELVPGIPSFCAAAARMDMPLVENREELHVLPASYDIEKSLHLPGTKVLMKAGRKMADVKRILTEKEMEAEMVENCGMEGERVFRSAREIPEQSGYYSLLVVKEKKGGHGK